MNHIAIIFGGPSAEHDVSLVSAKNIYQVIKETQIRVSLIGVTKTGDWKMLSGEELETTDFINPLDLNSSGISITMANEDGSIFITTPENGDEKVGPIDVAFPIIHGPYGEDGKLQNQLNQLGLEFVGSDMVACESSFDKCKTKEIVAALDIPQVPFICVSEENPKYDDVVSRLGSPFFIKPANMGSSVGISKVSNADEYMPALAEARIHDRKLVIEQAVTAREIECAIIQENQIQVSNFGEIKPNHDFYSYEAKYLDPNGAELIIPTSVPEGVGVEIKSYALKAFEALGCRDYARADFFLTSDNQVYFNEINTHPGFTNISQFPLLWHQEGLSYKELIMKLITLAAKRKS